MFEDDIDKLKPIHSMYLSIGLLLSGVLLYQILVDFELSVIELLDMQLRTHIFGIIAGMGLGGALAEAEYSDKSPKNQTAILSAVFTILFFGILTAINTEIASLVLLYVGLWYSINAHRIVSD